MQCAEARGPEKAEAGSATVQTERIRQLFGRSITPLKVVASSPTDKLRSLEG